jgi:hypothetical protein
MAAAVVVVLVLTPTTQQLARWKMVEEVVAVQVAEAAAQIIDLNQAIQQLHATVLQ